MGFPSEHHPTSFDVGVDENVATGQGPEILDHFIVFQCSKQGKGCVAVDDLVLRSPL